MYFLLTFVLLVFFGVFLRSLRQIDNCQVSILIKSSIYYLLLLLLNSLSNIVNVCFMWHGRLVTTCNLANTNIVLLPVRNQTLSTFSNNSMIL